MVLMVLEAFVRRIMKSLLLAAVPSVLPVLLPLVVILVVMPSLVFPVPVLLSLLER
jgi:hypothetical protein